MSDPGFSPTDDDITPQTVQANDLPDLPPIDPDDPAYQPPSIMGGLDFSGDDLPMRPPSQPAPAQINVPRPIVRPAFNPAGMQQHSASAAGISTALGGTGTMVDAAHGIIRQAGQIFAKGDPVLAGLKGVTTAITAPLTIGSGVANTFSDINHGASPSAAILGNGLRTAAVFGAGVLGDAIPFIGPVAGPAAAWAADKYLPNGATIGNAVINAADNVSPPTDIPLF